MWYFAWILGTAFACAFSVLCAIWLELRVIASEAKQSSN